MKRMLILLTVMALSMQSCGSEFSRTRLSDYVNPLQGTMSVDSFSTGNTYPAVAVPWGMNFWTPQTRKNGNGWQYVYSDCQIGGFKQTHQPSPWINDYGCFSVMPVTDSSAVFWKNRVASFTHEDEVSHPYYYGVKLSTGIFAEMTPTYSGSVMRFTYPADEQAYIVVDGFGPNCEIVCEDGVISGKSSYYAHNNSAVLPEDFATHFRLSFNVPVTGFRLFGKGKEQVALVSLDADGPVEMKAVSSFISDDQARLNFNRELAEKDFGSVCSEAAAMWDKTLSSISVSGSSEEHLRTFYSALYRTMLFPRKIHETDVNGRIVHFDFYNGGVREGYMFADNGFWDTFRAVHPLFTIICPSLSEQFMDALLNIYDEGGYLPEWFSPAYKDCMLGQHSVAVVTDAFLKGIDDFDRDKMMEAMIKGANSAGPNATGRKGFEYYNELGYVPYDCGVKGSVSRTLEYAYNDYCISLFAEALGRKEEAAVYRAKALNYKNIFDTSINFVRPKDKDGNWQREGWQPDTWGGSFTEGSSWHWTWCVYHDPKGLIDLMGGDAAFEAKLDSVFMAEPTYECSNYGKVIHEIAEMVAGDMGQYAHGNEPIQHAVYMYNYAGVPNKTQAHVRDIMEKFYHSGVNDGCGLCGDEDNGQTSAWYVFSALGFYPVCPGTGEYVIGSPLFEDAVIKLENGRTFEVKAHGNSEKNVYIRSAKLNGQPFNRSYITHKEIMEGGVLEFVMGAEPSNDHVALERPHSMSD